MREVVAEFGPWTAHNIHLGDGVFTIGPHVAGEEVRLRPVVQAVDDVLGDVAGSSVLDLACMEGLFSIEFARRGAEVLGIEGRRAHVARANFAKQAIGLDNVTFKHADVRRLDLGDEERFDLVLALGILYHLEAEDQFRLVESIARATRRAAIIDTTYSVRAERSWRHRGITCWGSMVREHDSVDSAGEREMKRGASLDNLESVWLTKPSLFNLLAVSGFTTVLEVRVPVTYGPLDRVVLLALKGAERAQMYSAPQLPAKPRRWREEFTGRRRLQPSRAGQAVRRLAAVVPGPLRRMILRRRRRRWE